MKIRWLKDTYLEIVTNYDEEKDDVITADDTFLKGEIHDVDDLESGVKGYTSMQFGDGSCAYGVPNHTFEIIEKD